MNSAFANQSEEQIDYTLQGVESPLLQKSLSGLETFQGYVGGYVHSMGEGIDQFFGDDVPGLNYRGSRLKVMLPVWFYENGKADAGAHFKIELDLPRTNHEWKLFVSSYKQSVDESNAIYEHSSVNASTTSTSEDRSGALAGEELGSIGLFYNLLNREGVTSRLDFGVNLVAIVEFNPFIRFTVQNRTEIDPQLESRFIQHLFVESQRGLAWDGQQIFDYSVSDKTLLRSQTMLEWWHSSGYYGILQKGIVFHRINSRRILSYYLYGLWNNELNRFEHVERAIGINWREKLYKSWLFGEIEPRLTSRIDNDFRNAEPSIMLKLEMDFFQ